MHYILLNTFLKPRSNEVKNKSISVQFHLAQNVGHAKNVVHLNLVTQMRSLLPKC